MSSTLLLVSAFLLVLLNGFFVAAEFGLVKLRPTRVRAIARSRGLAGRILGKVHQDLDAYLSACQLGITLASLGLGWIGEPAFADLLTPLLHTLGVVSPEVIHAVAFTSAFLIISYLHIVLGELAPKSLAIRQAERMGLLTAIPLYGFYWLMFPAIWALNHSAAWILARLGLDLSESHDSHYSTEELKLILRSSRAASGFTSREWKALAQSLDFRTLNVADLMRPFNEAVVLEEGESADAQLERMALHRFSRYPWLDRAGFPTGFIHVKDVFLAMAKNGEMPDLSELVRPAITVRPGDPAASLLRQFQRGVAHMAIVTGADGRPMGFITLDNLLGALVGEIRDEFRGSDNAWTQLDDGTLIGRGSLPIASLRQALGMDIEDGGADSISGLIMNHLCELPEEGQRIRFEGFDVVVKRMRGHRILLVRVYPAEADLPGQASGQ